MARYKYIDTSASFLAFDLQWQLLPARFSTHSITLSIMSWIYPALLAASTTMQPVLLLTSAMLIEVVFATHMASSADRRIERFCSDHVTASKQKSGTRTDFAHQVAKL